VISRHLHLTNDDHLLLMGPRGTGKSTLLGQTFSSESSYWIDLLLPATEDRFARDPERLLREVEALPQSTRTVVIDEIQKVPALLDVVHAMIESPNEKLKRRFILTGSSARKLKAGSANLLAGRALAYSLFPFTSFELADKFDLGKVLRYGTLPKVTQLKTDSSRRKVLETYALTYLNEEIRAEQAVRSLDPFRKFLQVAAQSNGKIVNFAAIARDVHVDEKTVRKYFEVLQDTLIGFFLESFHGSVRKQVGLAPKFFFFDPGVVRALARTLTLDLDPGSYSWGNAFEHFVILECQRLISYSGNQFEMNFLRTYDSQEIDLVVKRPGKPLLLIELKSTSEVTPQHVTSFIKTRDIIEEPAECAVFSCDSHAQIIAGIRCLHWQQGLREYFGGPDLMTF
jgi:predicted AAA+ superfamily ATPase